MSDVTISVSGLHKRFGSTVAVDGMSFTVRPGQVTGFVGPNGAGKSTTLRVILGLDAADAGTALINRLPYRDLHHPLRQVGSLLDASALQPSRTARNHLLWLAHSQGVSGRRVDAVLEQFGLSGVARRRAGGFSLGMRQRLGLAAALLGDPAALLLDEPFNGMDPEGIIWMRGFLRTLAEQGRAVLVSSHLMGELQDSADHLVVVGRGRVIADTSVAELLAQTSDGRVVLTTADALAAAAVLAEAGGAVTTGPAPGSAPGSGPGSGGTAGPVRLTVSGLPADAVVALLTAGGVRFSEVSPHRATLEEAYLQLTRDAADFRAVEATEVAR